MTARRRLATLVFGRNEREYRSSSKRKRSHCENDPLLRTNEADHPRPPDGIVLSDLQREIRSASLRFVALSILFANLVFGDDPSGMTTHIAVSLVYLVVSVASVVAAMHFATREDLKAAFVALDAILVAVILHEHILASPITDNHNLTTSSLVVAFVLLNHVALKLDQRLILLFSTIVVISWSSMLAIMTYRHHAKAPGSIFSNFFNQDLALTVSFALTSLAVFLLARDHDHTRRQAIKGEERRMNLSRFWPAPWIDGAWRMHPQAGRSWKWVSAFTAEQ